MVKFRSVARGLELKLSCLEDLQKQSLKCISERGLAKAESIPEQLHLSRAGRECLSRVSHLVSGQPPRFLLVSQCSWSGPSLAVMDLGWVRSKAENSSRLMAKHCELPAASILFPVISSSHWDEQQPLSTGDCSCSHSLQRCHDLGWICTVPSLVTVVAWRGEGLL